jgi:hypothetical protein
MFVSLLCDDNPHFEEKYPPGTKVERVDPVTNMLLSGTVMDIPFSIEALASSEDSMDFLYTILFDNGTTALIPLSQMADLISPPPVTSSTVAGANTLLPPFFCLIYCITCKHEGQYHKGYLSQHDGIFWFSYKSNVNKCKDA